MSELERISIVVPVYNLEKYIVKTVASICRQTYRNLEIILVDDGSNDGTPHILDELRSTDKRIKVIHKENGGVTSARMSGVSAATGQWIGFVDGDDLIEADMYERLLNNAYKYQADISHCGYRMVFPSRVDYYYNTRRFVLQDRLTGQKDLLDGAFIEPGLCNKLFRKTLFHCLLHSERMDLSIKNMEDLLMNFYLFKEARRSVYEDFCPYYYMVRKGSASTATINKNILEDPLKVFAIIKSEVGENKELLQIVDERILAKLISNATLSGKQFPQAFRQYRRDAHRIICRKLPVILHGGYGKRQKIMALWTAICPCSYSFVHMIYSRVTGNYKKYEVE